jgi:hypothetical protein
LQLIEVSGMRMANALQSSALIEPEHLGVTDRGKGQPQHYRAREKQSAKHLRNSCKTGSFAGIRLFDR